MKILTVKDRMEEKNVPSSYRESLDNTPSRTAANCESKEACLRDRRIRL